jgi:hypothetical protein
MTVSEPSGTPQSGKLLGGRGWAADPTYVYAPIFHAFQTRALPKSIHGSTLRIKIDVFNL